MLQTAEALIATSGLRTSLQEIAKAAGILTGSLYHHFESKEALLVGLVRRYHEDLARVGEDGLRWLDADDSPSIDDKIIELGSAIARCAVRNRAGLQMSFYEAPTESLELVELLRQRPQPVQDAMVQTLRAGRWSGYLRPDLELGPLADRLCQSMMHVGLDVIRRDAAPDDVAAILARIMLDGLARRTIADAELDASNAMTSADSIIRTWAHTDKDPRSNRAEHVRVSALKVFGRKGFEVTTIRDIAAAAELNPATVHRVIGSKDELLASIMHAFGVKTSTASVAVLQSDSSALEKLDALSWIHINAVLQFPDEWKIQLAWMRRTPPDNADPGYAFSLMMEKLERLLSAGIAADDIRIDAADLATLSRCVMDVLWVPENIIRDLGPRAALVLARDTVIRGIARRGK
ncbi:TetR/AcrR family transcriptional regulator [Aldersonia sp. NBC_00410]|uniref:TetR/AcrR family transcriptional regulator n=1 Tax=Aldersonia sp. NBC_00410 TaxID=2975954 RepID=UPI002256111E|nr:TetR/AcrR family transcriptional regulator [Aldersonia sp. NBC_00410]MCX5046380.1 TetR/AcrR family transcriptional regulator [Aldersonia sp. NBC_00410]